MPILTHPLLALALGAVAQAAPPPFSWVTLPNGVTIRYVERGDPTGTPIVLVHGFTDSWQSFARILPHIPSRYRVIALDLRGHGGSDRPAAGYGVNELADDVVGLLAALGLRDVTLVGHSLGSFVVRQVARRAPRRVDRLVLVGSAAWAVNDATRGLQEVIGSFGDQIPSEFIEEFQRGTFRRPLPPDFIAEVLTASASVPPHVWRGVVDGLMRWDDRPRLGQLRLPTLLMWGEEDEVFGRSDQDALLDGIKGAVLVSYRGTGHAPHWEGPAAFTHDLLAFIEAENQERR